MVNILPTTYIGSEPPNTVPIDNPVEQTTVPYDNSQDTTPPPPNTAVGVSTRAAMGIGPMLNKNYDDIHQQVQDGGEQALRQEAAVQMNYEGAIRRMNAIRQMASQPGALTPSQLVNIPPPVQANPDTVIEQKYAEALTNTIHEASSNIGGTFLDDAKEQIPVEVQQLQDTANEGIAKLVYARKLQEEMDNEVHESLWSWKGTFAVDFLKQMIPLYSEGMLRGNADKTSRFTGGLLGENLQAQAEELLQLPLPQYVTKLKAIVDDLRRDNPQMAQQFVAAVAGQSTSDRVVNDSFTVLDAIGLKGIASGIKNMAAMATRKKLFEQTSEAFKTTVKSSDMPHVPVDGDLPDMVAHSDDYWHMIDQMRFGNVGDVETAAEKAAAKNLVDGLRGTVDPSKDALQSMLTGLRASTARIEANPGNLSRELTTRLVQDQNSFGMKLTNLLEQTTKVQRTPRAVMADAQNGFKAIKEMAKSYYPGKGNAILDVSDPVYSPSIKTYDFEFKFGNYDGTLFTNPETAESFAKTNGLVGKVIGKGADTSTYYIPEAAAKKFEGMKLTNGQPTFYTDLKNEVSVQHTTKPTAGMIPVKVSKDGSVKFLPKLTNATAIDKAYEIKQQGLGFYISVRTPLRETDNFVRDALIGDGTKSSSSSQSKWELWKQGTLGWLRSSDYTLSKIEGVQRDTVAYNFNKFQQLASDTGKYIRDVLDGRIRVDPATGEDISWIRNKSMSYANKLGGGAKQMREEFTRMLDAQRYMKDEFGQPGKFFETPEELQSFYQANFKRPVSFAETEAYFAFKRNYEYDRILRNIEVYRDKARLGTEQHAVSFLTDDGKPYTSPFIEGVKRTTFPKNADAVVIIEKGKARVYPNGTLSVDAKKSNEVAAGMKGGTHTMFEVYDPEARPLPVMDSKGFPVRVRYVISDKVTTKPISFDQVGYRGGGHFEYDYNHYIKQAKIRQQVAGTKATSIYEGDATLMPIDNRTMGEDIVGKLNSVRELLANKDVKAAKALWDQHKLPIEWKEFKSWFDPGKTAEGFRTHPRFNLSEPFQVVDKDQAIWSKDKNLQARFTTRPGQLKPDITDGTSHGSLARNFQVKYTGTRDSYDMFTFKNESGSRYNPVYSYQPAKFVDPIATFNRSMNNIVNSSYMSDYKIFAIEHWLEENKDLLKPSKDDLRSRPFHHFENPEYIDRSFRNPAILAAMANRYKIKQLIGTPSRFDQIVHSMKQDLADASYGRSKLAQSAYIIPDHMLSMASDPVSLFRSFAFHAKLGLFNLSQTLVQANGWANIAALAPMSVAQGTFGAMLHQFARVNSKPEILAAYDKAAMRFGWKPGTLGEARDTLINRTGFDTVAGEYALDGNFHNYNFLQGDLAKIAAMGQRPFQEGERWNRLAAWYTSFHEFRKANPTAALTDANVGNILKRASVLTMNMSKGSGGSVLNQGFLSIPMQFANYQIKTFETMLGKQIGDTVWERTLARGRMFAVYNLLYGASGAGGLLGYPFGDFIRKQAIENGYTGENPAANIAMEGLPSYLLKVITGNQYNIGDRMGMQGLNVIRDALRGDTAFQKLMFGAAGSVLMNTVDNTAGWWKGVIGFAKGDNSDDRYRLKLDDFLDIFNEVSSVSAVRRGLVALHTGMWINKNEQYVEDISKANAIFQTATSLTSQDQSDMFTKRGIKKERDAAQNDAINHFVEEFQRGERAFANGDPEQGSDYRKRAYAWLTSHGIPESQWGVAVSRAIKGNEARADSSDYSFYLDTKTPTNQTTWGWLTGGKPQNETMQEAYRSKLKQKANQ